MLFELLDLLIGIAFGFFHKGKEDYKGLLRNGAIIGVTVGVIFVFVINILVPGKTGISYGYLGALGLILEILIFVVLFFAGSFIGDWLERVFRK
ncbi:MAG TPA: hypothetical protein PKM50_04265 [Methanoregula sp.]|nr:hypothetical protein [Methanoregula sp.]